MTTKELFIIRRRRKRSQETHVGTAALGCPSSAARRFFCLSPPENRHLAEYHRNNSRNAAPRWLYSAFSSAVRFDDDKRTFHYPAAAEAKSRNSCGDSRPRLSPHE